MQSWDKQVLDQSDIAALVVVRDIYKDFKRI